MTQDEIQMPPYLNASFEGDDLYTGDQVRELMKLVAAKEREACAKVLDEMAREAEEEMEPSGYIDYYRKKAAEIRARGQE